MTDNKLTKKESKAHEDYIASLYEGVRSKSSGAYIGDKFDVLSPLTSFELKSTGRPGEPRGNRLIKLLDKQADYAYEIEREPAVGQRFYQPESKLASQDGYLYITVRLTKEDADREIELRELRAFKEKILRNGYGD